MTPLECVQQFGANFCQCGTTNQGYQYCYYSRPATGMYTSLESCEAVWGVGQCVCPTGQTTCQLASSGQSSTPLTCNGQIYVFTGQKTECRRAGVMSAGTNCCKSNAPADAACSFANVSKEIGLGEIASLAFSLGTSLAQFAGMDVKQMLAEEIGHAVVQQWIATGTTEGILSDLTTMLGKEGAQAAVDVLNLDIASGAISTAGQELGDATITEASSAVAEAVGSVLTIAGWVYFAYQVYNMYAQLSQCTAGELMLGCKIAKGVCHHVGSRCKSQAFGTCLQKVDVYCCYNSKLARIINEQGLPQIGKSFGTGDIPYCKGFQLDEFVMLNLSDIDLSEYSDDLMREMAPNAQQQYMDALNRMQNTYNLQQQN